MTAQRHPRPYPVAEGLHPIVLTKRCTDPPMPHEARHAWAERMRRYEAAKAEAPAEESVGAAIPDPAP